MPVKKTTRLRVKAHDWMSSLPLRFKLTILIVFSMLLILLTILFMYFNLNRITRQMDEIYVGNVKLNELGDALEMVQTSMTDYLDTKSTDSLENYYAAEQQYRNLLSGLETRVTDNRLKLMERNIYYTSESYLALTRDTIEAKRGRNVEKYKSYYEEAEPLYQYINTYIASLNNYRFRANTDSYNELISAVGYLELMSIIMFGIMAAFDIMLIVLVTRNITQPLHELAQAANKVSSGKLDETPVVKVHGKDEVGVVTMAFNQMVSSIPGYMERLRISMETEQFMKEKELMMEANLKDARLKILQAQINPHFLFNTMNAGTQLAMMEHADRTYEYIQNVASFFRYNISKNDEVSLRQEIELVDIYIYILNVRFSGEICFTKNIESDELLDIMLPSMILQPIVENSINYGIRSIEREGRIELSVYRVDENVCISVTDNGIGMSQELIQKILSGQYSESDSVVTSDATDIEEKKGNGVGLNNVIERLRLYFDGANSFEIISGGRDQGTEVVITIPIADGII